MSMQKLSEAQQRFFETFGYLALPGLLADRIAEITEAFEAVFKARGGGHHEQAHDGKARSCIVPFVDQSEELCSLLDDPRIEGAAASLLGEDFNYLGSDGNYYVGDTGWHSDGWHAQVRHLKIAFYLDPLRRETGALRVIPGSHRIGEGYTEAIHRQLSQSAAQWGVEAQAVPAIALETTPGDVVVFNHNTKHAAFGGGNWRRMFTLNCSQRYPQERLADLKQYIGTHARFWLDRHYGPRMMETAGPGRRVHLEQVMANDGHLRELSAQARQTMTEPARG
jgi:hypothetical protein